MFKPREGVDTRYIVCVHKRKKKMLVLIFFFLTSLVFSIQHLFFLQWPWYQNSIFYHHNRKPQVNSQLGEQNVCVHFRLTEASPQITLMALNMFWVGIHWNYGNFPSKVSQRKWNGCRVIVSYESSMILQLYKLENTKDGKWTTVKVE